MFKEVSATNIKEYLSDVPENHREMMEALDALIRKTVPKLKPHFATNMLGYGAFEYLDKKTKEYKPWPIVALADRKNYVSVYICAVDGEEYVAEKHKDKLGKVQVGKSCINIKKLEDIDLKELKKILKLAEKSPGLVGATTK